MVMFGGETLHIYYIYLYDFACQEIHLHKYIKYLCDLPIFVILTFSSVPSFLRVVDAAASLCVCVVRIEGPTGAQHPEETLGDARFGRAASPCL
jgi:hypothetical protein